MKEKWSLGDTFNLSIGHGFVTATNIQLLQLINIIANMGKLYKPCILKSCEHPYKRLEIKNENIQIIKNSLFKVVNDTQGTCYKYLDKQHNLLIAGKTGTAQTRHKDITHAIFSGYAPANKPLYSISIIIENSGYGGKEAFPVANKIFHYLLHEKNGKIIPKKSYNH